MTVRDSSSNHSTALTVNNTSILLLTWLRGPARDRRQPPTATRCGTGTADW